MHLLVGLILSVVRFISVSGFFSILESSIGLIESSIHLVESFLGFFRVLIGAFSLVLVFHIFLVNIFSD